MFQSRHLVQLGVVISLAAGCGGLAESTESESAGDAAPDADASLQNDASVDAVRDASSPGTGADASFQNDASLNVDRDASSPGADADASLQNDASVDAVRDALGGDDRSEAAAYVPADADEASRLDGPSEVAPVKPQCPDWTASSGVRVLLAGTSLYQLAINDSYVYTIDRGLYGATNDARILAVPKDGGEPLVLASNEPDTTAITADNANVYWWNNRGCKLRNVASGATNVISNCGGYDMVIVGGSLFWVDLVPGSCPGPGTIRWLPATGGSPMVRATAPSELSGLASDGTFLYFGTSNVACPPPMSYDRPVTYTPALLSVPIAGGNVTTLMEFGWPENVASSSFHVATNGDFACIRLGNAFCVPVKGGRATSSSAILIPAFGDELAMDARHVYFLDCDVNNGVVQCCRVVRHDLTAGTSTVLANGPLQSYEFWIQVDETRVYFSMGPSVFSVPKDVLRTAEDASIRNDSAVDASTEDVDSVVASDVRAE